QLHGHAAADEEERQLFNKSVTFTIAFCLHLPVSAMLIPPTGFDRHVCDKTRHPIPLLPFDDEVVKTPADRKCHQQALHDKYFHCLSGFAAG
ncbi:hypothetical protein NQZ68_016412, partial [Dissostichus eleginoides]